MLDLLLDGGVHGWQDGGTLVIAGSHKIDPVVDPQDIINAAYEDPSLIHHVVAPAGSTLVFFEVTKPLATEGHENIATVVIIASVRNVAQRLAHSTKCC